MDCFLLAAVVFRVLADDELAELGQVWLEYWIRLGVGGCSLEGRRGDGLAGLDHAADVVEVLADDVFAELGQVWLECRLSFGDCSLEGRGGSDSGGCCYDWGCNEGG